MHSFVMVSKDAFFCELDIAYATFVLEFFVVAVQMVLERFLLFKLFITTFIRTMVIFI